MAVNSLRGYLIASILLLAGCNTTPVKMPEKVMIPVAVPCIKRDQLPVRHEQCKPANDSDAEYLRCIILDLSYCKRYSEEMNAAMAACIE